MSVLTQMVCDFIFTGIAKTEFNSSIAMIAVKGLALIIYNTPQNSDHWLS